MNLYKQLLNVLPSNSVDVGTVMAVYADGVLVVLPGGGTTRVRGAANLLDKVYIRAGVIEGPAPNIPVDRTATIEV